MATDLSGVPAPPAGRSPGANPTAGAIPPPPLYSPDGRWLWDSTTWVPAQPRTVPLGGIVLLLAAVGLVVGPFLPWLSASGGISSPSDAVAGNDGWLFVGGGALVALLAAFALRGPRRMTTAVALFVLGAAFALLLAHEWNIVHAQIDKQNAFFPQGMGAYMSYGSGLYVLAIAITLTLIGGLVESYPIRSDYRAAPRRYGGWATVPCRAFGIPAPTTSKTPSSPRFSTRLRACTAV